MKNYQQNYSLEDLTHVDENGNFWVEEWKDIPNYIGIYKGSNFGRIKSLFRYKKGRNNSKIPVLEKIMKNHANHLGYVRIRLSNNDKGKCFLSHRITAELFIPNPENKPQVNHKGEKPDTTDNAVWMIEWATNGENQIHAYQNNLQPSKKGTANNKTKFTDDQILAIRRLHRINPNVSRKGLSYKLGVGLSCICHIITRRTWSHI
jgi:hypothetical protein